MKALVVVEHDNSNILPSTLSTISAALRCCDVVHAVIAGSGARQVADSISAIEGVAKALHIDAPGLAFGLAEALCAQLESLANDYTHILFPATAFGKDIAPRLAARLDVAQVSDIIKVHCPLTFDRPIYAGNAIATVQSKDIVKIITVRTTAFPPPAQGPSQPDKVETRAAVASDRAATLVRKDLTKSARPELASAAVVVSGGRALGSAAMFEQVLAPLADQLNAALAASRAAVDAGFAPNDLQVGQTGKVVAPELYIACGISGAIQHLAGMKDSKVIVAINKDPEAPIFGIADYGLEQDLFVAIPELTALIRADNLLTD
jgi:electron transfer flavoprotein alpha subunit